MPDPFSVKNCTKKKYGAYIHIPFCRSKCKYCSFVSTSDLSLEEAYIDALVGEISSSENIGACVDTVYFGGGTPSCLKRGSLSRIFEAMKQTFDVLPTAEITVECNPESVDTEFADECKSFGANRISMGLQSTCNDVLSAVGRVHTYENYCYALDILRARFDNISTDLILGLPRQDMRDLDKATETVAGMKHVSVYALSVEQGTPLYAAGYSVDDDIVAERYEYMYKKLTEIGFRRYEVSNFAKQGFESRHNIKYWRCEPYMGFGAAAHGYDGGYIRYAHTDDINKYIADPSMHKVVLTESDRYNEYIMLALRTERGIDRREFCRVFGRDFCTANEKYIEQYTKIGAIVVDDSHIRISPEKLFVMNGIIEDFMVD